MDLKKFKLELINQIMQTNDLELLQTIQQILSLNNSAFEQPKPPPFHQPTPVVSGKKLDEAAQELQDSIDEVFNP